MDSDKIYMLLIDGSVYVATKWGLNRLGAEKMIGDTVDGVARTVGVKAGKKAGGSYMNDAVMFLASKWLYQNYVYDMLMGAMPADGFLGMENIRNSIGIAGTLTLIRAFQ